eukprot:365303-Chlamydomonas_euryale.AAC.25
MEGWNWARASSAGATPPPGEANQQATTGQSKPADRSAAYEYQLPQRGGETTSGESNSAGDQPRLPRLS